MNDFNNKMLKQLRLDHNYSLSVVGELTGLNKSTIANYESGKTSPCFHALVELSKVFQIPMENFVRREEEEKEEVG
ncbi:MAG: helix-turn-helix domain-containing protein [Anaerostipes sp.]|nr:helix-turn-helix transcriptional regulator [Anaerostipes sp.]